MNFSLNAVLLCHIFSAQRHFISMFQCSFYQTHSRVHLKIKKVFLRRKNEEYLFHLIF